jgi:hypothetical protein
MPTDETPRQPQALQAGGRLQPQADGDAGHGAYPEQVFAGESGDPIWEPLGTRAPAGPNAPPRMSPEEKVSAGRLIDLVQPQAAKRPRPGA